MNPAFEAATCYGVAACAAFTQPHFFAKGFALGVVLTFGAFHLLAYLRARK